MRVHELASELGLTAKKIIEFLQNKGYDIKGPLNNLGKDEITAVRDYKSKLEQQPSSTQKSKSSGTKKKVFIRSKTSADPRYRRPTSGTQQARPTQIRPRKPGHEPSKALKAAKEAVKPRSFDAETEKQKAIIEAQKKAERTAIEAKKRQQEIKERETAESKTVDKHKKTRPKSKPQEHVKAPKPDYRKKTPKKEPDTKSVADTDQKTRQQPRQKKRRPRDEQHPHKPKFTKEGAAKAARESRVKPQQKREDTQAKPDRRDTDRRQHHKHPDRAAKDKASTKPQHKHRPKDKVLEGKDLDLGISKLQEGFKTSVDDPRGQSKVKRRKKIVQDKRRFKPAQKIKTKDTTQYDTRGALVKKKKRRKSFQHTPDISSVIDAVGTKRKIRITDHMTIKDLSASTGIKSSIIVKFLLDELNIMATINQVIDKDIAAMVLDSLGFEYEIAIKEVEDVLKHIDDPEEALVPRPPVVTVLGHVDHGKTRLLDTIRKTNVAAQEAGGITQAIGAYQVKLKDRAITFIDTPGHEAFTEMRARGAKVTDVAILVVACDDGVQPQTIEAIDHAKAAGVEIVVALNKIDLESSDPERVKGQLADLELVPEEWGGKTVMVPISAKFGQGIEELLELVLLQADILDLKAATDAPAWGTIIEAKIDKGKGALATVLVQRGTLHKGDYVVAGCSYGRIRAMLNEYGKKVSKAGPSAPVEVFGLSDVPQAGDVLNQVESEKIAKEIYENRCLSRRQERIRAVNKISLDELYEKIKEGVAKELNLIIKTDTQGSIEAITHALKKIENPEVDIKFVHSSVGNVKPSDIMLAIASNSIIIAFNVVVSAEMKKQASMEGIDIRSYNIIYKAVEDIEKAMKGMLEPEYEERVVGTAEVRAIFKKAKGTIVAGLYVTSGKLVRNHSIRILRNGEKIWDGKLSSLKRFQDDAREIDSGLECGVSLENITDLQEGDIVEDFEIVEVPRA